MQPKKIKSSLKPVAHGLTDIGKLRSNNEDAYCVLANNETTIFLYAVADGMGGHAAGEVASGTSIKTLRGFFDTINTEAFSSDQLRDLISQINKEIYNKASRDEKLTGMGNTLSILFIQNNQFIIGHVGDSRVYRLREDTLEQLTIDHTEVQSMIDAGFISKDEARHHPLRNLLRQAIGVGRSLDEIFILEGEVHLNDQYLLCSDGLTDMLEDEEIKGILSSTSLPEEAVNSLINGALEAGGRDNVTAIVVRIN